MAASITSPEASSSRSKHIPHPVAVSSPIMPERYASLLAPTSPNAPEHKGASQILLPSTMIQLCEDELAPKRHRAVAPETDTGMTEKGDDRQLQAASLLETAYGAALYSKSMSDKIMGRHAGNVKATHVIPSGVKGNELAYLFGDGEVAVEDRKNGELDAIRITLHAKIEEAMDARVIAIIPSLPVEKAQTPTQWRCVLTKESYRDRILSRDLAGHASRWNLKPTGKPFLLLPVHHDLSPSQDSGEHGWAEKIETSTAYDLWPLSGPGGYLERYTLQSIGRNISGFGLPASLYEGLMSKAESPAKDPDYDTVLSMRLREVLASGMKGLGIQNNEKFGNELRLVNGARELEEGSLFFVFIMILIMNNGGYGGWGSLKAQSMASEEYSHS
ncbi:hypothetical protein I7I51_04579 [Histoplasma capsulatum]|uniref:HNH nuclease domain-containing protein n=1 Tax=Ajellomyces capsulatus TaxID=5037 RepID=A0A8A1M4V9_AJECA|nr:hypothetical protein I7I51_04579 [Histoplasma capsulatum]